MTLRTRRSAACIVHSATARHCRRLARHLASLRERIAMHLGTL